jgi:hypothetical protein
MKKLSNAQQKILNELTNTILVVRKYNTFEDFFDNSKYEQETFTTASYCNDLYNSAEKYKQQDLEKFEKMRTNFELCKNEAILITYAKTETINALVKLELIEVIEHAKFKGGAELVKVLNI